MTFRFLKLTSGIEVTAEVDQNHSIHQNLSSNLRMYYSKLGSNCRIAKLGYQYYQINSSDVSLIGNNTDPNMGMMTNTGQFSASLDYYITYGTIYKFNTARNQYLAIYTLPITSANTWMYYDYELKAYQNRIIVVRKKNAQYFHDPFTGMSAYRTGYEIFILIENNQ